TGAEGRAEGDCHHAVRPAVRRHRGAGCVRCGAPAPVLHESACAGAGVVVLPCRVGGHAGRHAVAHRQDVLARGPHGANGGRDSGAEPRRGPWATAGWASASVACGDGGGVKMADLTPDRLLELRLIAEAATPGPWAFPHQKDPYGCYLLPLTENNASYIAAFDPTTVLALLDRIEELEAVLRLVYDEFVLDV